LRERDEAGGDLGGELLDFLVGGRRKGREGESGFRSWDEQAVGK